MSERKGITRPGAQRSRQLGAFLDEIDATCLASVPGPIVGTTASTLGFYIAGDPPKLLIVQTHSGGFEIFRAVDAGNKIVDTFAATRAYLAEGKPAAGGTDLSTLGVGDALAEAGHDQERGDGGIAGRYTPKPGETAAVVKMFDAARAGDSAGLDAALDEFAAAGSPEPEPGSVEDVRRRVLSAVLISPQSTSKIAKRAGVTDYQAGIALEMLARSAHVVRINPEKAGEVLRWRAQDVVPKGEIGDVT